MNHSFYIDTNSLKSKSKERNRQDCILTTCASALNKMDVQKIERKKKDGKKNYRRDDD
ncbi:hypothetical protein G15_0109 [Enterococcus avium]|nr:hypothetical protein G15_0109 [Enterococcus avium]